jgi:hypothetical protein
LVHFPLGQAALKETFRSRTEYSSQVNLLASLWGSGDTQEAAILCCGLKSEPVFSIEICLCYVSFSEGSHSPECFDGLVLGDLKNVFIRN